jgi:hypothetical protein
MGQDDSRPLKIASSVATDLALLERRTIAERFQVEMKRWPWPWKGPRTGFAPFRFPSPARGRVKARKPLCTTSKYGLRLVGQVDIVVYSWHVGDTVVRSTCAGNIPTQKVYLQRVQPRFGVWQRLGTGSATISS